MSANISSINVRAVKLLFMYVSNSLNAFGESFISSKRPRTLNPLNLKITPTIDLLFLHTKLYGNVETVKNFNAGRSTLASGVRASKGILFTIP